MNLAQMQADYQAEVAYRQHWAARVRMLRARLRETQPEFGRRFGVSAKSVQDWESGAASGVQWESALEELERESVNAD